MMGFFDDDFYKELDKNIGNIEDLEDENFPVEDKPEYDSTYYADNMNLQVNKNNKEKFKTIMDNASEKLDSYWDIENPVIRVILIVLLVIIVVGLIYYIIGWITLL